MCRPGESVKNLFTKSVLPTVVWNLFSSQKHFVLASLYAESAERSWPNGRVDLGKRIPFGFVHCTQQTALTIDMMIGRS